MRLSVSKLKKSFHLGLISESEYFAKRLDMALRDRFRYRKVDVLDRFAKTQIGIRHSERCSLTDHGESVIDAIMGKTNCLILINCMGGWQAVWQGRLQITDLQESYESLSIYHEAIAAGASVHKFSTVLEQL